MMHVLDYDRALGELLELDDTVRATFQKLKDLGELEDTLVVVTADHGHVSLLVSYSLLSVHLLTLPVNLGKY
jgi:arylsulfatase A-like enzyme